MATKNVIFSIGCGGSGKSYYLARSEYSDLAVVNSDSYIESHPDYISGKLQAFDLHEWASEMSERDWYRSLEGSTSFVYDGTGKTRESMERRVNEARQHGFEVVIIYVYVPLHIALERNRNRPRVVPSDVIIDAHKKVKNNWAYYKNMPNVNSKRVINI